MGLWIEPAQVEVRDRPEGYREFRCTPTHWFYDAPFSHEALYADGVSNRVDLNEDPDFWSASDAALRVRHVPAAELDIREMVLLSTQRGTDYNAEKPWAAAPWVEALEAAWSGGATHIHPARKIPTSEATDLWRQGGMPALSFVKPLMYPLQTGRGIGISERPPRIHEPWHGGEGVWFAWSTLEEVRSWQPRQDAEPRAAPPEEGCLLLFVSHRWESLDHPDPTGRQLEAIRAGLTMGLSAAVLLTTDGATPSGLPELFARWLKSQNIGIEPLKPWAEQTRDAAQGTLIEKEFLEKALSDPPDILAQIRERVLLWYDYTSMYQASRTAEQESAFRQDLRRLNSIQAGAATLVLAENDDYTRRAWCFLEVCGGVRGLIVEITPSWGKRIGAYQNIQRWAHLGDQLIGALVIHGLQAIRGSGLRATHDTDLPVVAELLSRLPLFGLASSSKTDLIGGSIPTPRRPGGWVAEGVTVPQETIRDGPPLEFGTVPDVHVLEWVRLGAAEADGLRGEVGMWIYTSQLVLSLAWAAQAPRWLELAGIDTRLAGVACTWADSRALADDGRGWTRYVPSDVETLVIVTQSDLNRICRLLDEVQKTHLAAGTTVITVMPDTGRTMIQRPPRGRAAPKLLEADALVVPRVRKSTADPLCLLLERGRDLADVEAMAALRLDPTEGPVRSMTTEKVQAAGARRVALEAKARLSTSSWDNYAKPRLTAKAWADPAAVLRQLDVLEQFLAMICEFSDNPFERRQVLYGVLEHLKLTHDEPLTDELLVFVSKLAEEG